MATTTAAAASIECSDQPLDLSFHPLRSTIIAAALVDGTIEVHDFSELIETADISTSSTTGDDDEEIDSLISSTNVHTQLLASKSSESGTKQASARCVLFSSSGENLYSGGTAGDLACMSAESLATLTTLQNSKPKWSIPNASYNASPLQVLLELPDPNLIVTGDDAGGVRVWDIRLCGSNLTASSKSYATVPGCVHSWKKHDDYISGLECSSDGNTLLAASADCTLSIYDLRMDSNLTDATRFLRRSDDQEDELLSIKLMKNGRKVVCGTGEGVLCMWSWGTWGDISDRFPGHPQSIDALLKVDENTMLTGSSDGLIRVLSIHPNKLLGVIGDHEGFPIEKLAFNADRRYVGSITHDNIVRLWDAQILSDDYTDDNDDAETEKIQEANDSQPFTKTATQASDDEWSDMDEASAEDDEEMKDSDSQSGSDSDSDSGSGGRNGGRSRHMKTDNEAFFEDL